MNNKTLKIRGAHIVFGVISLSLGWSEVSASCENPDPPTISVSGASASNDENYYIVGIPTFDSGPIKITVTGSGSTPCLSDSDQCECGDDTVAPEKDGELIYTFSHQMGQQTDNGSPTLEWNIEFDTSPGEYKFKVTNIEQKYKSCPDGHTGGVSSKSNLQASDEVTILAVKIELDFASTSNCDGESLEVDLDISPDTVALSGGSFTWENPSGTGFDNPDRQGSTMTSVSPDFTKWSVDNLRWFSQSADQCNVTSQYTVKGSVTVEGVNVDVWPSYYNVSTSGSLCVNGGAGIANPKSWVGGSLDVEFTDTGEVDSDGDPIWNWRAVGPGTTYRDVQASYHTKPTPQNSQFLPMVLLEELYHAEQFEGTKPGIDPQIYMSLQGFWDEILEPVADINGKKHVVESAVNQLIETIQFDLAMDLANALSGTPISDLRKNVECLAKQNTHASHVVKMKCFYGVECP